MHLLLSCLSSLTLSFTLPHHHLQTSPSLLLSLTISHRPHPLFSSPLLSPTDFTLSFTLPYYHPLTSPSLLLSLTITHRLHLLFYSPLLSPLDLTPSLISLTITLRPHPIFTLYISLFFSLQLTVPVINCINWFKAST